MIQYSFTFIGQIVPQELLDKDFEELETTVDIAGNTFYTALLEGLAENGCEISAMSRVPQKIKNGEKAYNGVKYKFAPYTKINIIRFLLQAFSGIGQIIKFKSKAKQDDSYAIFNVLRISSSVGAIIACKILKVPTIGVVTDVPGYRLKKSKTSLIGILADKIGQVLVNRFDMYVLLSEAMRNVIDIEDKPYTVIEGIYDSSNESIVKNVSSGDTASSKGKFEIIYAGSLHYQYGIMNLVKAVQNLQIPDIELSIYGKGEAADEINKVSMTDSRIVFGGLIPRSELLEYEKNASLLVNPRPVDDEYVKYSFPSKNMEYMASGTPVLLTEIPSLPDSYKEFVVLVETNDSVLLGSKIKEIYENREKYVKLGKGARKFINSEKNKREQANKVLNMIKNGKQFSKYAEQK